MQIVEYHEGLLPSLTRLINQQIALLPPGLALGEAQVARAIEQGGKLWDIHTPEDHKTNDTWTVCVLEHREVVAGAQWLLAKGDQPSYSILWLVAQPNHPLPLRTLLHLIHKQMEREGALGASAAARFAFGVGWCGLPITWTHVIDALGEAGYSQTRRQVLLHGETDFYRTAADPRTDPLRFYWNMNKPALEWGVTAYQGEVEAGDCQVWGIPPHLEGCPGFSEWATVERITVRPGYQRRGVGKRLLAEQMRFQARRGVTHFAAWVDAENRVARRLHEAMGFVAGPEVAVMVKP